MNSNTKSTMRTAISRLSALALAIASTAALAQPSAATRDAYPELAELFNAFDVTQAQAFDEIMKINENPYAKESRDSLEEHLYMMANMTMKEMMASGMMNHSGDSHGGMSMASPYGDLEVEARITLRNLMRESHSDDAAVNAFDNSEALNRHTAEVLKRGRSFENALFNISAAESVRDKRSAVADAVAEYRSDSRHAVASTPKDTALLVTHPQANAFKTAFPRLSGFDSGLIRLKDLDDLKLPQCACAAL